MARTWAAARELKLRQTAIDWLKFRTDDGAVPLTRDEILDFKFEGDSFRLQPTQQGIRKPAVFDAALSIQTVYRPPGKERPYDDTVGADGLIRYMWRGDDPALAENRALRRAMELELPLIWFIGVGMKPALFQAVCPVYIIEEEPELQRFVIAPMDEEAFVRRPTDGDTVLQATIKRYMSRETKVRLHQPVFRSTVLRAYEDRCAVCNLGHRELLDAAHIIPDSHDLGIASVVNGMALCKIHHAAFDSFLMGIRPDHVVQIRPDLLEEVDGPMLQHGLKELHGKPLMKLPSARGERPKRELLDMAYGRFLAGTAA
ncbi:HNH endonuclease [Zafaria cholistanensis]|uniref:HNH endonuclease n=1 Tax=Zafaria cholistanensis TaxID=1682741 RepID=A0A5A7NUR9_9MICC|nr:HNH endonuclease [Zafaria cholistanensis]GER23591.1 HNH endonuclease [Zafaria cholistanensis]